MGMFYSTFKFSGRWKSNSFHSYRDFSAFSHSIYFSRVAGLFGHRIFSFSIFAKTHWIFVPLYIRCNNLVLARREVSEAPRKPCGVQISRAAIFPRLRPTRWSLMGARGTQVLHIYRTKDLSPATILPLRCFFSSCFFFVRRLFLFFSREARSLPNLASTTAVAEKK